MFTTLAPEVLRDELIFVRALDSSVTRSRLYRQAHVGELSMVTRGVYLEASRWIALTKYQRHRAAMVAVAALRPEIVFSHRSAAVAWSLPVNGPLPTVPEFLTSLGHGGRSDRSTSAHRSIRPFERVLRSGLPTTPLARTLLDVARRLPASLSVPMLDHCLRTEQISKKHLFEEWISGTHIGSKRAHAAIVLADGQVMSVGESWSRVQFDSFGIPQPELQVPFYDDLGLIGYVDFWWPGFNAIGEFDGHGKYLREEFLHGQTPGEAVIAEKHREDRLRATQTEPSVGRWGWTDLSHPAALRRELARIGVPLA